MYIGTQPTSNEAVSVRAVLQALSEIVAGLLAF